MLLMAKIANQKQTLQKPTSPKPVSSKKSASVQMASSGGSHTGWQGCIDFLVKEFTEKEKRQDEVLLLSRQIIRACASAIRDIHNGDFPSARKALGEIEKMIARMRD